MTGREANWNQSKVNPSVIIFLSFFYKTFSGATFLIKTLANGTFFFFPLLLFHCHLWSAGCVAPILEAPHATFLLRRRTHISLPELWPSPRPLPSTCPGPPSLHRPASRHSNTPAVHSPFGRALQREPTFPSAKSFLDNLSLDTVSSVSVIEYQEPH